MTSTSPRSRPVVSDDNIAPVVQIVIWLLLSFIILSVEARVLTKSIVAHTLGLDDLHIVISLV